MIKNRVEQLRKIMDEKGIYAYIIPSSDFHQSEYVGEYFKSREFITGFTGSAGTAVITKDDGGLWTDGRYYLQAEKELENSGVKLFKSGLEGVPEIEDYLKEVMPENSTLGFDGKVISVYEGEKLRETLKDKNIKIAYEEDLIDSIWKERISMSDSEGFLLDIKYVGEDFVSKLKSTYSDINITQNNLSSQIKILNRSDGGSVEKIKLGNKELTGRDIRNILNLNSANFEIKFDTNSLDFVVKGYGHGVGMSQWGANGMAEEGYKYYEILSHYYKDTTIKDLY